MSARKVTQDLIAQELGLSRNTVSKVFNGSRRVTETTRRRVLTKAFEMNYPHPLLDGFVPEKNAVPDRVNNTRRQISILCHGDSFTGTFWPPMIKNLTRVLAADSASTNMIIVSPEDENKLAAPEPVTLIPPDGIVLVGLFSSEYYKAIAAMSIPFVSLDISCDLAGNQKPCDLIMKENREPVYQMTKSLIAKGHTNISFIGNHRLCQSFHERYLGYTDALSESGILLDLSLSYTPETSYFEHTAQNMFKYYRNLPVHPTAFVCMNDMIASQVVKLTQPPYSLFSDAVFCGFDNTPEHRLELFGYATVDTPKEELGVALGELILWRLAHPDSSFRTVRLSTRVVYSEGQQNQE